MSNELDSIFGRKPDAEQPPQEERDEILEVYVTTSHKNTFKCVTISKREAQAVLPLVMSLVLQAVHEYIVE